MFDRYASSTKGNLNVASAHDDALGCHAMRADLARKDDPRRSLVGTSVDVDLAWMSDERFALTGFELRAAYDERPARLLRQGLAVRVQYRGAGRRPASAKKWSVALIRRRFWRN